MKHLVLGILVLAMGLAASPVLAGEEYLNPVGGWRYTYNGSSAAYGDPDGTQGFNALDGTWSHQNGSDKWDGTGPGTGMPGGISVLDGTYIRMQDTGDPRDYGMGDPTNRKLYLGHSVTADIAELGDSILNDGITISFRSRVATGAPLDDVHPDGSGKVIVPWPEGGDGYVTHNEGKGNFGVRSLDDQLISFSLALGSDLDGAAPSGLLMNNLNGNTTSDDVDPGDGGTLNVLPLDPTLWHEFWIIITADPTATGTHLVSIYKDGSLVADQFFVTAGTGDDYADSYIALGLGSTDQSGAFDVDFFSYKEGIICPMIPEPMTMALLGLGTLGVLRRRKKA